jgi:hypothetical protein
MRTRKFLGEEANDARKVDFQAYFVLMNISTQRYYIYCTVYVCLCTMSES